MSEADELRRLIHERTGIEPRELECPREQSFMTPCVARDGQTAVAYMSSHKICVGCGWDVGELLAEERGKWQESNFQVGEEDK
jgi:hypothetical protein